MLWVLFSREKETIWNTEACDHIDSCSDVASKDVEAIRDSCEKFAADFIKHVTTFDELQLILR